MQTSHIFTPARKETLHNKLRDPFSGISHLIAALLSLIGLGWLMAAGWGNAVKEISFVIYGLSLVFLFTASAVYHLVKAGPEVILKLRKFDHSAIYILIAGTYTPLCLNFFSGFYQWGLPAIEWGMALLGLIINSYMLKAPRWLTTGIYLVMGWLCMLNISQMVTVMPVGAIFWLILGGLFYSIGAVVYITKKPNLSIEFGFHEIWHIFVILGAFSHFISIAGYIA